MHFQRMIGQVFPLIKHIILLLFSQTKLFVNLKFIRNFLIMNIKMTILPPYAIITLHTAFNRYSTRRGSLQMPVIQNLNPYTFTSTNRDVKIATQSAEAASAGYKNIARGMQPDGLKNDPLRMASKLERVPNKDTLDFFKNVAEVPQDVKKVSAVKRLALGIASALVPGLGQMFNSDYGKAIGFFVGSTASAAFLVFPETQIVALGVLSTLCIWSVIDAAVCAKPD